MAAALAVGCSVLAQSRNTLEFCLAWDMPKITFGSREKEHNRYVKHKKEMHVQYVALQQTTGELCHSLFNFDVIVWFGSVWVLKTLR